MSGVDGEEELAEVQVRQEAELEVKYWHLKKTLGVDDPRTLAAFFKVFDLWIMLYRLNKADQELVDIVPAASKRKDNYYIQGIQALAFTRWKQSRFRESLARFHEMEGLTGKNPALCENIGHTYNSLGEFDSATIYFEDALRLTKISPDHAKKNEGGILLGLAGIKERQGDFKGALPIALKALDYYKAKDVEQGWEGSLTAKASMQCSKLTMKLGKLKEAERYTREAIRLFILTSGEDSPLTAHAYQRLGDIQVLQGDRDSAREALHRAYELEAIKDSFDIMAILEIHNRLVETHLQNPKGLDRQAFTKYFKVVNDVVKRVRVDMKQDANAGAYYKTAGELFLLGNSCNQGLPLLQEAHDLISSEKSFDVTDLLKQTSDLMAICQGTYGASKKEDHDEL